MVLNIAVFGSGWGFGQPVQNSMLMFDVVSLVEWNTYLGWFDSDSDSGG